MRITADTTVCVGSGMCALTASHLFDQSDDDGSVILLDPEPTAPLAQSLARDAVGRCPSGALRLHE